MAGVSYPVFIYSVPGGFVAKAPDFPNAAMAFGPDHPTVLISAEACISAELARLKSANIARPPPTSIGSIVSTKGGRVELILIKGL